MGNGHSRNKNHEKYIDFEGAEPSGKEQDTYNAARAVLQQGPEVLQKIEDYEGCQELARMAMSQPTYENEKAAFEGLLWAVDSIACFFDFSDKLEKLIPDLLMKLANTKPMAKQKAHDQPALMKQLAEVFDFCLQFDQTRMMRPNLSNDFSYYRRLLPKFNKHPNVRVKDEEASGMALFTAEHIPMMKCLAKGAARAYERDEGVALPLSLLANSCLRMIKDNRFSSHQTNLFCARAMAGAIVLFDHIVEKGVFNKKSSIPVGSCIQMLQRDFPKETALTNAIRFSTKNFKNAPDSVQNLFD